MGADMRQIESAKILANQQGMAMIEAVPLLVIFVVLMSFGLGFFGTIHTATLHSIGARTYAFETFRQRSNLSFFREDQTGLNAAASLNYTRKGWRYHAVGHETDQRDKFVSTARPIALGSSVPLSPGNPSIHNQQIFQILPRNERIAVNPIWVMVGYGICLNAACGK